MDQISCPVCNRDYELPKRHMKKFDDYDFLPIPRLLPCLHTACHSCLETSRETNKEGKVCCPICEKQSVVKGIRFLPLDISTLKQMAHITSTEIMAVCCECYENVPSVSWCETCSSALCEFHYQDHKLSYDTSKHNINTLKEIAHNNLSIEYKFPPISCPESLMCDCSIYCHECMYLISADSMIKYHKTHKVEPITEAYPVMKKIVESSTKQSEANNLKLKEQINQIQTTIRDLDTCEEQSIMNINKQFNTLHKRLKKRENELLDHLNTVVEAKRAILLQELTSLTEEYEDSKHVLQTSEMLLENTAKHINDSMYLVAATETIDFHTATLSETISEKISQLTKVNPEVKVDFIKHELATLNSLILSLGSVEYGPDVAYTSNSDTIDNNQSKSQPLNGNEHEAESKYENPSAAAADGAQRPLLPEICFSVIVEDMKGSRDSKATDLRNSKTNQYITVEARLLHPRSAYPPPPEQLTSAISGSESKVQIPNGNILAAAVEPPQQTRGELLGKVILHTNIDRRLLSRHELRSYFESTVGVVDKLPLLRISKELVPSSTA